MTNDALMQAYFKIRNEIKSLQKAYCILSLKGKHAFEVQATFDGRKKDSEMKIATLKEESIYIVYENSRRTDFTKLDLHGLYLDEAEDVVMLVIEKVRQKIDSTRHLRNGPRG